MTSKKAFTVWILVIFTLLAILSTLHAWTLWLTEGPGFVITIFSFPMDITIYLAAALTTAFLFIGGICYVTLRSELSELPLHKLGKDFEEKLSEKNEEIKNSTDEALAKLGLREFQLKESLQTFQKKLEKVDNKLKNSIENQEKNLEKTQKKLTKIEHKLTKIQNAQDELPKLKEKLLAIKDVEKDLQNIKDVVEKINPVPEPYITSTHEIQTLEGKLLKRGTVQQLKLSGIEKVEDLILKSPVEIALTKTMTESEAKSLQSVIQLLMIPGVQHGDAVLLLKSGVNSKQELALQDTFSLGARLSKTAELYIREGKIKENEKPTLEEIASWIKWAKT